MSFSFVNPLDVANTIHLGTIALAEAARQCDNLQLFIFASSSEVYGRATVFPTPETSPLGATSPYAVAKIAAEEQLRVMGQSYGFPFLIIRPFNTFGRALVGSQHFVVERAIVQALLEGHIRLHDPRPHRAFIFRSDHVQGYLQAIARHRQGTLLAGETINLASGVCYSIAEMAQMVAQPVGRVSGREVTVEFSQVPDRPLDIPRLQGDGRKARELLGWTPQYSLEDGLAKAVEEWASLLNK